MHKPTTITLTTAEADVIAGAIGAALYGAGAVESDAIGARSAQLFHLAAVELGRDGVVALLMKVTTVYDAAIERAEKAGLN